MNFSAAQLEEIVARHRQLSAAEHGKYVVLGMLIGAALVGLLWSLA